MNHQSYIEKSTWKRLGFFHHWNYIEKSTWKWRGFFDQWNYIEKVRRNDVDFSAIEITSKKSTWKRRGFFYHQNYIEKVGGSDLDFLISEITLKKYNETMWKFVEIWSLTYRRNILVKSTWCARWVLLWNLLFDWIILLQ